MTTRELIEAAFADVPYPGNEHVAYHECEECDDIRAFFRGKSWRDLKFPELYGWHAAINLLAPQALHYFLPGFMLASLGHWKEADHIPEWILYAWLPCGAHDCDASRRNRIERQGMFSLAQRKAIAAFLRDYQAYERWDWMDGEFAAAIANLLRGEIKD